MTITVNQPEKINAIEGQNLEFKTSAFYAPGEKEQLYGFLKEKKLKPAAILLTHTHFDHIHGAEELSRDFGGLTVYYSEAEREILADREKNCRFLGLRVPGVDFPHHFVKDGEKISLPGLTLEVLATPGHTPGCVCYLDREGKVLISGDTLFAGTIGRTDGRPSLPISSSRSAARTTSISLSQVARVRSSSTSTGGRLRAR